MHASQGDDGTWLERKAVINVPNGLHLTRGKSPEICRRSDQEEQTAGDSSGF